jgi:nucleoside-diphosphate-sugar epimerase
MERSNPAPPAEPRRVLVLGAAGRFGAAAVAAFAEAGWQVLAQARRAPAALPRGAVHLGVELADTAALARAAVGAAVVVHAVNPAYTEWQTQLLPLARPGMDVAGQLGATFMLPGNVYPYGSTMPALLREDTPWRPDTVKGRLRAQLEEELAARAPTGLRSVVIRAGDFYGAGQGSWLDLVVVKSLAAGKLVYPGPLDVPHAWAYLPDLARAFVAVAAKAEALGGAGRTTLHFAGHALTGAQWLDAVECAALRIGAVPAGRSLARGGMPWALIRAGGLVVPMWREIAEMAYLWRVPHALAGERLSGLLGAVPATPVDEALGAALRALGHGVPATS